MHSKHLPGDTSSQAHGSHYHSIASQSTHGVLDLQSTSTAFDATARSLNNKAFPDVDRNNAGSSSTGSNNVGSTSKMNSSAAGATSSTTNVVYEVHDWWTEQVNSRQSSDDEDE